MENRRHSLDMDQSAIERMNSGLRHRHGDPSEMHPRDTDATPIQGVDQPQRAMEPSIPNTNTNTNTNTAPPLRPSLPPRARTSWTSWVGMGMQVSLHDWVLIGTMIFGGCCSNVFALEILVNDAPKSGQMITFAQFVCVSLYGLAMHLQWPILQDWWAGRQQPSSARSTTSTSSLWRYIPHLKPRKIPMIRWLMIVVMFFTVSVLNNQALAYRISVPLHIIFRSGGLMVGMVLGMILMKKRYSPSQIFAVTIVTIGVIYATTSAKSKQDPTKIPGGRSGSPKPVDVNPGDYAIGVVMLTVALIISSLMGLLQESTYQTYGSEWREGLFYSHFLAVPMFLLFYGDILEQFRIFNRSTPIPLLQLVRQVGPYLPDSVVYALSSITIPRLWIFLAVNTLTQFMCISGVHRLTSLSSALTLNFILNLRKFTSLMISVLYFENGFGFEMAVGSSLVLLGTFMYSISSAKKASPPSNATGRAVAGAAPSGESFVHDKKQ